MMLLKMLLSILLLHVLWLGLVLSLRNVRTCGCPRMTYRTLLPDLRLHLCSFGTSILTLLPTVIVRTRCPPKSQPGERARVGRSQQDGDAQQQEAGPLLLPQLTRLHEAYHVQGEDASSMPNIPLQHRVTMQILRSFNTGSPSGTSNLRLWSHSVLSSSDSAHKRVLSFKPMG